MFLEDSARACHIKAAEMSLLYEKETRSRLPIMQENGEFALKHVEDLTQAEAALLLANTYFMSLGKLSYSATELAELLHFMLNSELVVFCELFPYSRQGMRYILSQSPNWKALLSRW